MRIAGTAALATACALALGAGPASAARDAELSIMDDQALLGASQAQVDRTLSRIQALGADRVRISAFWSDIAPSPHATKRPAGFDPRDPYDPKYRWAALDRVVGSAATRRIKIMLSLSTPAPFWGSARPELRNAVWSPDKTEFAGFAHAVASRYVTVVDQFAILNEPNQGAWLQPQSSHGRAESPHLYRAIVRTAYPVIKRAAPRATILVGELASSGRDDPGTTRPIRPLRFLRLMGCRDARFRAIRSGRCIGFKPATADAIGHHPYALFQSPFQHSLKRDDAAIGDSRRLTATLDRLVARRALEPSRGRRLSVHYTEFGYQTDPPDPFAGIPLRRQERWLQDAAYVVWRTPRIRALNQFRVSDGRIRGKGPLAFREFQSGLWFAGGRPKPASRSFPNPIVVRRSGRARLLVWGQARVGGAHQVVIERRAPGARSFRRLALVATDAHGYFQRRVTRRSGSYRFRWVDVTGRGTSQAVSIGR